MHVDLSLFPLGGVLVVQPDLSEYCYVYHDLQHSTNNELRWSFTQVKVSGLEDVTASPHEHHLKAEKYLCIRFIQNIGMHYVSKSYSIDLQVKISQKQIVKIIVSYFIICYANREMLSESVIFVSAAVHT